MMNKKGRKYNREKWGWKDEEHCHYSGLPSPSSYKEKHPYYESDRKIKSERFSLNAIAVCAIGVVILWVCMFFLK